MNAQSVLFLSHSNIFEPFRVGSHHYATELALRGYQVFHVSTPVSVPHRILRRTGPGSVSAAKRGWITDESGVHHLVPSAVIPAGLGQGTMTRLISELPVRNVDFTLIDQPLMWTPAVRSISRKLIYRPTDTYDDGRKARLQNAVVAQADGVVATSDEVLRQLGLSADMPSVVIPNGVDARNFVGEKDNRRNVAIYVGALDARFNWADLRYLAEEFRSWSFEIFGPAESAPSGLPSNISVMGSVDYEKLGSLFARSRIGLLPLTDAPVNAGRSPMKLYEYLAGGLGVLSTSTPSIQERREMGLLTYGSRDELRCKFAVLAEALPNEAGVALAASQSWNFKADQLLRFAKGL